MASENQEHEKEFSNVQLAADNIANLKAPQASQEALTDELDTSLTNISNLDQASPRQNGVSTVFDEAWSDKSSNVVDEDLIAATSTKVVNAINPLGELALALKNVERQKQKQTMDQQNDELQLSSSQNLSLVIRHAVSGEDLMMVKARPTDTATHICEAVLRATGEVGVALQILFKSRVLDSRTELAKAGISDGDVLSIVLSPLRCITTSFDGTARIRHLQSGVQLLVDLGTQVRSAALAPGGSTLLMVAANGAGSLWCAETGVLLRELHEEVLSCSFAADGQRFTGASDQFAARVWCAESGDCLQILAGHTHDVKTAHFSHDGQLIVTSSSDWSARLFVAHTGACLHTLDGHLDSLRIAVFSPDDFLVASASMDATARIWSVATGECLHVLHSHTKPVHCLSFASNGQQLLTASFDGTLCVWQLATGQCVLTLPIDNNIVKTATFSPDGSRVLVASGSNYIRLFSVESGECCLKLVGHEDWVRAATFSPDGMMIVSASYDGTARVWNAESGECLQTLLGHTGAVVSAEILSG